MREEILRKRLEISGRVQGVGFRWRARHAAEAVGATGWVRNNPDGSVSMELQGSEAQIDRVIQVLEQGRYIEMEELHVKNLPVLPEERRFVTKDDLW